MQSDTKPPALTFDGGLPTFQALWGTSPVSLRALLRPLRANPAKMVLGGNLVDQGAPALAAGDLDQAVDLLGWLVSQEDPLPLELSFQGSLCLKVEVPPLLSFFQLLPQHVLIVILELLVVHGAKEVPAHLTAAWHLPGLALGQGHRGGWEESRASYWGVGQATSEPKGWHICYQGKAGSSQGGTSWVGLCNEAARRGPPCASAHLGLRHLGF